MTAVSGLEDFLRHPPDVVRGQRIGLVTNPAAVDRDLLLSIDALWAAGAADRSPAAAAPAAAWRLTRLFGPEHGVRGDYLAGGTVADGVDALTGLPETSLYGA